MKTFIFLFFSLSIVLAQSHSEYSTILKKYVVKGKVNYKELKEDSALNDYLDKMKNINPDTISDRQNQLAFWINIYNAYTLKIINDNYPLKSINDLHSGGLIIGTIFSTTIWDDDFVIVNNKRLTLNEIEHDIIRPIYKDPRAHFALVCASVSCPPLRPEAYEGSKLDKQLNDQAKIFLNDTSKNYFDVDNKKAYISKIFDWFNDDFGNNDEEILIFIAKFIDPAIAAEIKIIPSQWDIKHLKYDWGLNE